MSPTLIYQSSRSVTFRDDSYRWVDDATFRITDTTPRTAPIDVLDRLLLDDHYVDTYQLADRVASRMHGRMRSPTQHETYLAELSRRGLTPETDPMRTAHPNLWIRSNRPGPDHGPYVLSAISPATFDRLDGPRARQAFIDWLTDDDEDLPRDDAFHGDLDGIMAHLDRSGVVFRLHDLGDEAEHAFGWIVQPYLELITIDVAADELHLIAAGTD